MIKRNPFQLARLYQQTQFYTVFDSPANWMDATRGTFRQSPAWARYRHQVYANDTLPRWVVVFGLQWQVIESQQLEAAADLYGAIDGGDRAPGRRRLADRG